MQLWGAGAEAVGSKAYCQQPFEQTRLYLLLHSWSQPAWGLSCTSLPLSRPRGQLSAGLCPTSPSCLWPSLAVPWGSVAPAAPQLPAPALAGACWNLARTFCPAWGPYVTELAGMEGFSLAWSGEGSANLAARRSQQKKLRILQILSMRVKQLQSLAGSEHWTPINGGFIILE